MENHENIPHLYNENCFSCNISLTVENKSQWGWYGKLQNGEIVSVNKCLICAEIDRRLLESCVKKNNEFVPTKTIKDCQIEIELEGITIKMLQEKEIFELFDTEVATCQ